MKRVGAVVIAAGVALSVSLLRPPVAVGQASREINGGGQESGVQVSQDADGPVRAWQGSTEEALLGRRR
jgi:hypothetical protein